MTERFRSTIKGICYCCGDYRWKWLYPAPSDFFGKVHNVCAHCSVHTYGGKRAGFTYDGIKLLYEKDLPAVRDFYTGQIIKKNSHN